MNKELKEQIKKELKEHENLIELLNEEQIKQLSRYESEMEIRIKLEDNIIQERLK